MSVTIEKIEDNPEIARIAWVDVETTGIALDSELLEVACIITDGNLNILDETGFQRTIHYTQEETDALYAKSLPFVQEMHTKNGIWESLKNGTPLQQVDEELHAYLAQFQEMPGMIKLAGNSVRLDLNALQNHLPKSYAHLRYRFIDVSTVEQLTRWWTGRGTWKGESDHTAMADIRASLEQLKKLRTIMGI